MYNMIPT